MHALAALIVSAALVVPAGAEIITARSPCLPATLPPSADIDSDATLDREDRPAVPVDVYRDFHLRGSIYGEAAIAGAVIDPQARPPAPPADPPRPEQDRACS